MRLTVLCSNDLISDHPRRCNSLFLVSEKARGPPQVKSRLHLLIAHALYPNDTTRTSQRRVGTETDGFAHMTAHKNTSGFRIRSPEFKPANHERKILISTPHDSGPSVFLPSVVGRDDPNSSCRGHNQSIFSRI